MVPAALNKIFKSGSTTYSTSSLFFPKHIRDNITILYAFVRTLDNFVDKTPQDIKGFNDFKKRIMKHDRVLR
jgi:phytoene synthase